MFTKTTITLLGLLVVCEVCTLIVFGYQRTVRKLAMRLKVPQSALAFCYPRWMLAMYWGSFVKFGIIIALFVLDWRCGLVSLGVFALFFGLSIVIPVPDGRNLIWIRRKVKRCGSRAIGVGIYQFLMREIDQGIVATGGDLEKLDAEEHENVGWNTKTSVNNRPRWFWEKAPRAILNNSTRQDDTISLPSNDLGESSSQTSSSSKPDDERTWRNAPACIKCAIALIGIVIVGGMLLAVFSFKEVSFDLVLFLSCVLLCLFCWACHILKGKNWTRVFSIAIVILFLCNPGLCYIGSVGFTLLITALLFCPGANKWFVSWPRGRSYWPVLLVVAQIVIMLINQSTFENSNTNSIKESTSSQEAWRKGRTKHPDTNINYANAPIEKVLEDAQDGIADAQANLGLRYATGKGGVELSSSTSFKWYRKAAENGHVIAQRTLGIMYKDGTGVTKDDGKAFKWFLEAAKKGDVVSQGYTGYFYAKGLGVGKDEATAFKWFNLAAERGDAFSQYCLAVCYDNGIGVEGDDDKAFFYFGLAADQGIKDGQEWFASKNFERQNFEQAFKWFYKAALQGSTFSQTMLGTMYEDGVGTKKDVSSAINWYRIAAQNGEKEAQKRLQKLGVPW